MLSSHTVSLPLALELRTAGYPQDDALFYWKQDETGEPYLVAGNSRYMTSKGEILAASPLASELLEALPNIIKKSPYRYYLEVIKLGGCYAATYQRFSSSSNQFLLDDKKDKSVTDVLAKLWKHLKAEKII